MKAINDISFWQNTCDFETLKTKSAGVILRAGQGTWEDVKFQSFRDGAKLAGVPFGNYWYYDNDVAPKRQAEKWASIIGDDHGDLGCWLDLEDANPGEYKSYKHWWDCVAYFKQLKPNAVLGIYTRASYFDDPTFAIPVNHAFRNLPLWVAHYGALKPDMPKGWEDWLIWQYSENGDGHAHGVGSHRIDMNWYKGDIVEAPKEINKMPYSMTTMNTGTRIRKDHNTFAEVITSVSSGVTVSGSELWTAPADGNEVKKGDQWLKVTYNGFTGWMAYIHKGVAICKDFKEVTVTPTPDPEPVTTFPVKFTLTTPDGKSAEYQFVKVL